MEHQFCISCKNCIKYGLPSSIQQSFLSLCHRLCDTRVTQRNKQIRKALSNTNNMRDDDDIDVLYVVVDVFDEKIADKSKEEKSWNET